MAFAIFFSRFTSVDAFRPFISFKSLRRLTISQKLKFHSIALALAAFFAVTAGFASGQTLLDPTFNGSGKVTTQIMAEASKGYDVAIQADGKIVVVGSANSSFDFPNSFQLAIARYNSDGSLDTTFSGDGVLTTATDTQYVSKGTAVTIQSDGKIVVAGSMGLVDQGGEGTPIMHRYNSDGTLDTTFDGDGIKILPFSLSGNSGTCGDVSIQPDGKIVVVGNRGEEVVALRLNPDGSTDTLFGLAGTKRINVVSTSLGVLPKLVLEPDGKILISAPSFEDPLIELNADGTINNGFGSTGRVNGAGGSGIVRQSDGKILVVNTQSQVNTLVKRYNSDGTPDPSFGTNGVADATFTNQEQVIGEPAGIILQPDGKILVGCTLRIVASGTGLDFGIARLNASGSFDTLFGFNGRLTTNIVGDDWAQSLALQSDGKIVEAGYSGGGFTVTRYVPSTLANTCRPVSDFNGDGKSDIAYVDLTSTWRYALTGGGGGSVLWGLATDRIIPADYNGDCRTDFAVYRDGTWYIKTSTGGKIYYYFGNATDVPVPADYDGDDLADPAVYRDGTWYIQGTRDGASTVQFGLPADKPVNGDYDGDGREDVAVYRSGTWYLWRSTLGITALQWGLASDIPVVGDYDGDGKSDVAVFRPSDGTWYVLRSSGGFVGYQWGISTDIPVPADYDGDGKTDVAVYRNGAWYMLESTAGFQFSQFGGATDRPLESAFIQ